MWFLKIDQNSIDIHGSEMIANTNHLFYRRTMVENRKKHGQNSHPIIHCPTSEGVSEVSGASERVSSVSKRANRRASGPVLQSLFLTVIDHSVRGKMADTPHQGLGGTGEEVMMRKKQRGDGKRENSHGKTNKAWQWT